MMTAQYIRQLNEQATSINALDTDGLLFLWGKIKEYIAQHAGSSGGTADSVEWENILNKPELVEKTLFDALKTAVEALPTKTQMDGAIATAVSAVYRFRGSVQTAAQLPTTGLVEGDVYNVIETDMNYAWVPAKGSEEAHWDPLGGSFKIDPISNETIQQIVDGVFGGTT